MNLPRDVTSEDVVGALSTSFAKNEVVDLATLQGCLGKAGIGTSIKKELLYKSMTGK